MTGRRCVFCGVQARGGWLSGMGPEKASGGRVEGQCGLSPPTLSQTRPLQDDDEPLVQPILELTHEARPRRYFNDAGGPTVRNARDVPNPAGQERVFVHLLGRLNGETGHASRANPQ
jgi:hypothetical protein